jgi:receptor protein-tyrosine kinase
MSNKIPNTGKDRGGSLVERAAQAIDASERFAAAESLNAPEPGDAVIRAQSRRGNGPPAAPKHSRFCEVKLSKLQRTGFLTPNIARSRTKEEFRVIKRAIIWNAWEGISGSHGRSNVVMVTSSRPNEGKTYTAINLAMSIASERDCSVLLIDADFTRPNILKTLGLDAQKGLTDVLEEPSLDLSDVLIRTNVDSLTILPAGRPHDLATELLASLRMRDLVTEIATRYKDRIIIVDSPPILSTSEPNALAAHVGQIIFVVEAGKTPKSAVKEALGLIDTGAKIGFVLNRARPQFGFSQFGSYYQSYKDTAPKTDRDSQPA